MENSRTEVNYGQNMDVNVSFSQATSRVPELQTYSSV